MRNPIPYSLIFAAAIGTSVTTFAPQPADARPSTRTFTCSGVKNYVHRRGAVVMNAKNSRVYRRFVSNRSFCYPREGLKRYSVPTKTGRCTLYFCYEFDYWLDD